MRTSLSSTAPSSPPRCSSSSCPGERTCCRAPSNPHSITHELVKLTPLGFAHLRDTDPQRRCGSSRKGDADVQHLLETRCQLARGKTLSSVRWSYSAEVRCPSPARSR